MTVQTSEPFQEDIQIFSRHRLGQDLLKERTQSECTNRAFKKINEWNDGMNNNRYEFENIDVIAYYFSPLPMYFMEPNKFTYDGSVTYTITYKDLIREDAQ
ncbi:hypothetical protein PDM89_18525 [Bacillus cereus]|nr:hypothetical protein [Bacillus cereus]